MLKKNENIKEKRTISLSGLVHLITQKKWKGGRLKKRLYAHASRKGQLIISKVNVKNILKASWLSPEITHQRFPRGKENNIICLLLLIDKRSN